MARVMPTKIARGAKREDTKPQTPENYGRGTRNGVDSRVSTLVGQKMKTTKEVVG